jgi:hypothetical protein
MKRFFLLLIVQSLFVVASFSDAVDLQEVYDAGLPVLSIITVNGEEPTFDVWYAPEGCTGLTIKNATKVPARMTISHNGNVLYDSGEYVEDKSGLTIKVRGNTSAIQGKTPYKMKLQKKADLLNRGDNKFKDKNWALINDEDLLTMAGLKVNELVGLQWTPAYEYVNVVMNGRYLGLYMLVETTERNVDSRLNVSKTGYIFEYSAYWWKETIKVDSKFNYTMQYTYKYPESDEVTEEQHEYLMEEVKKYEMCLPDGAYDKYIDVNSLATWMVGHDIVGCNDGAGSNIFLTKYDNTSGSKIMMGNMWDFDSAFKRTGEWDAVHDHWFFDLLFNSTNRRFVTAYKRRWNELKPTLFSEMDAFLTAFANSERCIALDNSLVLDRKVAGRSVNSVVDAIESLKQWFSSRKIWLDEQISQLKEAELGDINCDGSIDKSDLNLMIDHIMGKTPEDTFDVDKADVDQDGHVNVADVVGLTKLL